MKPLHIKNDRMELLFSDNALRLMLDGGGLLMFLSEEQRIQLSLALWRSVHPLPKG